MQLLFLKNGNVFVGEHVIFLKENQFLSCTLMDINNNIIHLKYVEVDEINQETSYSEDFYIDTIDANECIFLDRKEAFRFFNSIKV
jgi:hypothetical protein